MIKQSKKQTVILLVCLLSLNTGAQEYTKTISFGNMDKWRVRVVKESGVIGGQTKYLYEIASGDTLFNNVPYKNKRSPWATSTVMAKVKGVTKTSITVFPEKRGEGYCARLETRLEECKVLKLINIKVVASGTVFLGEMVEPITGTGNPQSKLVSGIPFSERPIALMYDYKVITGGFCTKASGFGRSETTIKDKAETILFLQSRREDENGNIYAKRVATACEQFDRSVETWQNGHRLPIHYGDISQKSFFHSCMGLKNGESAYYTRNSKGKMVPVLETEWATGDDPVTHIILQFSSSNGGAYIGSIDSRFWIDNVKLVYESP